MWRIRTTLSSLALLPGLLAAQAQDARAAELVMFEQQACEWCAMWNEEIGPAYPKTEEGRRAPLRRVDIHAPMPDDLADIHPGRFTPTFVLVDDGEEIGRIRGYPGEDFFWGLLGQLLEKLDTARAPGAMADPAVPVR